MPAEIEIKLAYPPSEAGTFARRLLRHPAVAAHRAGRTRTTRLVSTYYDTADGRLAEAGIALRVRQDGRRWLQTVKGPPLAGHGAGLHAHDEHEWALPGRRLDPAYFASTPWHELLAEAYTQGALAPRFTTDFRRHIVPLAWSDGTAATLCIDAGAIRAHPGALPARRASSPPRRTRVPIAEIEIELSKGGERARLFELAQALAADLPLAVGTASKAERGHALANGWPDGWRTPVHASGVEIADDTTVRDALQAVARECLHQIAANALGLVCDRDPEWVHQMRVGTRRLRSCLTLGAGLLPADRLGPALAEVKWLATLLGHARDWDVFATQTLPPLVAHFGHEPATVAGLRKLRARAAARRRAAHEAAVVAVGSRRFQHLVLAAAALVTEPPPEAVAAPATAAPVDGASADAAPSDEAHLGSDARAFAQALLQQRHKRLAKRAAVLEHATRDERHAARIAAKKLRYAAEFFAPLFRGKRAREYLHALSGLQDVLGRYNDGVTATRLALELDQGADTGTSGLVRGWVAAQSAALEPELAKTQARAARAKRFWS